MNQDQSNSNPWNGHSAEDIQKGRTFQVNLPTCFTAQDVLDAVSKNLNHSDIDMVAKKSYQT